MLSFFTEGNKVIKTITEIGKLIPKQEIPLSDQHQQSESSPAMFFVLYLKQIIKIVFIDHFNHAQQKTR
ncbi:hypothetical protein AZH43_10745 [Acinetobacter pragensis]|uniref:Uncharacterized protein n=1 Tax=Acinetobacter pragensis TaxID=1806892 RepID=A0A151Y2I3_9GAMM|nr:hypothetical protein AZH43_10745 [Acinetobacter pragensis]